MIEVSHWHRLAWMVLPRHLRTHANMVYMVESIQMPHHFAPIRILLIRGKCARLFIHQSPFCCVVSGSFVMSVSFVGCYCSFFSLPSLLFILFAFFCVALCCVVLTNSYNDSLMWCLLNDGKCLCLTKFVRIILGQTAKSLNDVDLIICGTAKRENNNIQYLYIYIYTHAPSQLRTPCPFP